MSDHQLADQIETTIAQAIHSAAVAKVNDLLKEMLAGYARTSIGNTPERISLECILLDGWDIPGFYNERPTQPDGCVVPRGTDKFCLEVCLTNSGCLFCEITNNPDMVNAAIERDNLINTPLQSKPLPVEFVRILMNSEHKVDVFNGDGAETIMTRMGLNVALIEETRSSLALREQELLIEKEQLIAERAALDEERMRFELMRQSKMEEILQQRQTLDDIQKAREITYKGQYERIVSIQKIQETTLSQIEDEITKYASYRNMHNLHAYILRIKNILATIDITGYPNLPGEASQKLNNLISEFYTSPLDGEDPIILQLRRNFDELACNSEPGDNPQEQDEEPSQNSMVMPPAI